MSSRRYRIDRRNFLVSAAATSLIACKQRVKAAKDADVVIVGAGLSGLFAAMTLQNGGYRVMVLEASSRVDGRMWTLDDLPGRPEAGGTQVGQTYARIRFAARQTGMNIIDATPKQPLGRALAFGDIIVDQDEWLTSPRNPFPEAFKRHPPDSVLFAAAAPQNPLGLNGDWRTPEAFDHDISAAAFLRDQGFNETALDLTNIALNANDLKTYSMLNVWRTLKLFALDSSIGPAGNIEGGSQRLPEAMARSLGENVRMSFSVQSVAHDAHGVVVSGDGGSVRADFCVLALPFPAAAKLVIDAPASGLQAEAIARLPYTQIVQLHLEPQTRYWESDGLSPVMWTDSALERIFANRDPATGDITSLTAWINGERARATALQDDDALEALAQSEIKRLRPASNGRVKLLKAVRWTDAASYAGGAYMHWGPGQAKKWATAMTTPLGRVYFAGEHLSHLHTGMEGAMEAGERAALEIIEASQP